MSVAFCDCSDETLPSNGIGKYFANAFFDHPDYAAYDGSWYVPPPNDPYYLFLFLNFYLNHSSQSPGSTALSHSPRGCSLLPLGGGDA